jgi:hypothetical protein
MRGIGIPARRLEIHASFGPDILSLQSLTQSGAFPHHRMVDSSITYNRFL